MLPSLSSRVLVATGILLLAAIVFLAARKAVQSSAVVAAIGLTIVARMISDVILPELTLAAVFPAMVVWMHLYYEGNESSPPPRPERARTSVMGAFQ